MSCQYFVQSCFWICYPSWLPSWLSFTMVHEGPWRFRPCWLCNGEWWWGSWRGTPYIAWKTYIYIHHTYIYKHLFSRWALSTSQWQLWHCLLLPSRPSALSRPTVYATLNEWLQLYTAPFEYPLKWLQCWLVVMWLVPSENSVSLAHILCTPYNHALVYSVTWFQAACVSILYL